MKWISRQPAFTLIEILIACAIISVIMLSVYSAFQTGMLSYRKMDSSFNIYQTARSILNRMELDLVNSFAYQDSDSHFKGSSQGLEFFSDLDVFQEGKLKPGVSRIKYDLDGNTLKRASFPGLEALQAMDETKAEGLTQDLKDISFQYGYATGNPDAPLAWQDSWPEETRANEAKTLPLAVKIKLILIARNTRNVPSGALEFTKTIYLANCGAINE